MPLKILVRWFNRGRFAPPGSILIVKTANAGRSEVGLVELNAAGRAYYYGREWPEGAHFIEVML